MVAGNLTRDPELKALPSGNKVVNFGVATNFSYKDQSGQKQEKVEYHNIVAYGKTAEVIGQYFKKGKPIFIEGRLETQSWDGTDGKKNYKTQIVLENFQFMGDGAARSSSPSEQVSSSSPAQSSSSLPAADQFDVIEYPDEDINPEDIPF